MGQVLLIILLILLYLLYLYVAVHVCVVLFALGCVVVCGGVIYNYLVSLWETLVAGGGWMDAPHGSEPAYRQYFFRKAYFDYKEVVEETGPRHHAGSEWIVKQGTMLLTSDKALFTWPIGVVCFATLLVGWVTALGAYVVFGLIHLSVLLLCGMLVMIAALLSRSIEYVSMAWRRIFLACPHAGCYKKIKLPIYICGCGAQHHKLMPGTYGVFRRRCKCKAKLPTLFLFGRNHQPSICPHCSRPLNSSIGPMRNIHIPIIGGPAAGKTSFLMANMFELRHRSMLGELTLEFPEKKDEAIFEQCYHGFSRGSLVTKTVAETPDAFLVVLKNHRGRKNLLYVYDAAGELFQGTDTLLRHDYYTYIHGILFLIDPFSLPQLRLDFGPSLRDTADRIKPCDERPQDVYDRLIGTLRQRSGSAGRFKRLPMAVVVTKVDAFDLEASLQPPADLPTLRTQQKDPQSDSVRQWLIDHGEGNVVRSIEGDFDNVRFFYCSALGRLPSNAVDAFVPKRVFEPVAWILKSYRLRTDSNGHP